MTDFISMGEILIDLAPYFAKDGSVAYQANPGGAPANVACVLAKLGHSAAFAGKIGNDVFGESCIDALKLCGVSTAYLFYSDSHPTTLSVVHLDEVGNRRFSFYRKDTADVDLTVEDMKHVDFSNVKFFHFGAVSMTESLAKATTLWSVEQAKSAGCYISYDPNLRLSLWPNEHQARKTILSAASLADVLKLSLEEGEFLFGEVTGEAICCAARNFFGTPIVLVTMAEKGCVGLVGDTFCTSRAFSVPVVDTTGAGDAFLGGVLHCLINYSKPFSSITKKEIQYMLDFGNAIGSLMTTKKGVIPSIPLVEEIFSILNSNNRV